MKGLEFYSLMPSWLQNMACSAYGYEIIRRRYGGGYCELENEVFARAKMTREELFEFRWKRLQAILQEAAENVRFYRNLFGEMGIRPTNIRSPDDFRKLPILSKADVQEKTGDFRNDLLHKMSTITARTSGTTGAGLVFPLTVQAEQEQWATWWRYRSQFGIDRNTWYAHFYGRNVVPLKQEYPPFWRVNFPGRQILFSGYHMSDRFLHYYVKELNRRKPLWIQGYPSLLALLAGYMRETGNHLHFQPKVVTIGAESLLPHQRRLIEEMFGAPCRQHYGTTEGVANISECNYGRLHVDEDFSYVEFEPGEHGEIRIVGTNFANSAFPLIRYQVGDNVCLADERNECPCGNPGRVVESIDGRIEDYVVTSDGRRIGRLDHIFKDMVNVRESQIVQYEPGRVEVRLVRSPAFRDDDIDALLSEARQRLGVGMEIIVKYVDRIERSKTGKLRLVVSHISEAKVDRWQ